MRRAANIVIDVLTIPLDNLYIEKYCSEEMRSDILEMISGCVASYREMLAEEDWLSEETRGKAIEKLDNMTARAAYPDEIEKWHDLEFKSFDEDGTLFDAVVAIRRYKDDRQAKVVHKFITISSFIYQDLMVS